MRFCFEPATCSEIYSAYIRSGVFEVKTEELILWIALCDGGSRARLSC